MNLQELVDEWSAVKGHAEIFCFASGDPDLRVGAVESIGQAKVRFGRLLEAAIEDPAEPDSTANTLFCLLQVLDGIESELRMWQAIYEHNFSEAWDFLVAAQDSCSFASQGCPMLTRVDNRLRMLDCLERILFPPQIFSSPGMLAEFKCSICELDIKDCAHIRGRVYRGRLCYHIATSVEILEFSIVAEPADRRRRITSYSEGTKTIDKLTNGPSKQALHMPPNTQLNP